MKRKGSGRVRISRNSHQKLQLRTATLYARELEKWNRRSFPVAY